MEFRMEPCINFFKDLGEDDWTVHKRVRKSTTETPIFRFAGRTARLGNGEDAWSQRPQFHGEGAYAVRQRLAEAHADAPVDVLALQRAADATGKSSWLAS